MRPVLAIVLCTTAILGLSACAPDDRVLTPSGSPTPAPTATEGEGTLPPQPVNESIGINCTTLISDQAMYDWGSGNFALNDAFVPDAGSSAAQIAADGGLACQWINLTSQETVDVAVSIPTDAALATAQQAAAAAGTAAPALGDAYFRSASGVGYIDVFSDGYWLTMQSTWFFETNDALPLVEAATAALPPLG